MLTADTVGSTVTTSSVCNEKPNSSNPSGAKAMPGIGRSTSIEASDQLRSVGEAPSARPSDTPSASGPKVTLADDYTVDLSINDGTPYSAHAQAQLTLFGSTTPTVTGSCFNRMFPGQTTQGKMCTTTTVLDYGRDGEVVQ